ncbi:MAG: AAA family ATPase, partial [Bacilli bacterium]|nr:AAA family ATPase [Bacilli bacterium]
MPDQLNNTKEKGVIETITVNGATFEDAPCPINPNLINYFYGQNGTGKSTLAEQVKTDKGLTMQPGQSLSSYDVLVFNQDFVESNMTKVKSASGLGAVFMLDANNRRINGEISKIRKEIGTIEANIEGMNKALVADIEVFNKKKEKQVKSLFSACAYLRDSVPQLFFGYEKNRAYELYKSVSGFTGKTTENASKEDLINFYNETIVETSTEENYPILSIMTFNQFSKEQEDLWTPFIDSSNSQFKDFLEEMSAANWFLEGYNQFKMMPNPQNKCPYCQQTLPEGFDDTVEKAFDKTYINGIERIKKFFEAYRIFHDEYIKSITDTSKEKWISEEAKKKFDAALKGIEAQFDANAMRIQKKLNDPAWKIQLVDLGPYVKQMLDAIYANNEMVRSVSRAKKDPKVAITKARDMMFSLIMQENKAILDSIKDIDDDIEELKNTNKASVEAEKNKIKAKNADIDEKLAQLTNTGTLVD